MIARSLPPPFLVPPKGREFNGSLPTEDRWSIPDAPFLPEAPPANEAPDTADARAEFASIVGSFYTPLFRFGLSLTRAESGACDLVQQTFLKWARYGHQLRDRTKIKTWLFTTLHREFLALCRRARDYVDVAELDNVAAEVSKASSPSIDARSAVEAIGQLEDVFRAPVAMFYLEEMSYLEISEALEIPVGTVMSRLSRGRSHLRRILGVGAN